ncbi:hypothetical protein L1887_22640 [Cichorium endivia]|nr:hypothetical protein L1887_22640 [Cichorium endivia]
MFSISQPNLLSNKKKKLILSSIISEDSNGTLNAQWFEGLSWSHDESLIAYVAEGPGFQKPTFNDTGYKKDAGPTDKDCNSWKWSLFESGGKPMVGQEVWKTERRYAHKRLISDEYKEKLQREL